MQTRKTYNPQALQARGKRNRTQEQSGIQEVLFNRRGVGKEGGKEGGTEKEREGGGREWIMGVIDLCVKQVSSAFILLFKNI